MRGVLVCENCDDSATHVKLHGNFVFSCYAKCTRHTNLGGFCMLGDPTPIPERFLPALGMVTHEEMLTWWFNIT